MAVSGVAHACVDKGPTCMGAAELPSGKDSELLLGQVSCSAGTIHVTGYTVG